jgi:hypothetical protein
MMHLGSVRKVISYNSLYLTIHFLYIHSAFLCDEFHPYVPQIRTNMNTEIFAKTNKCVFFLVRHCRYIQEAYTKILLNPT